MAIVSRTVIKAYNKCIELAVKFGNILDSFLHKDDITEDATHVIITKDANTQILIPKNGGGGGGTLSQADQDAIASISDKLDKVQAVGTANRRFVINANGTVTVAPELGTLQNVEFIDGADADSAKDTLRFTFVNGSTIDVDVKDLFDVGALSNVATASNYVLNFTTLGNATIPLDLSGWFASKANKTTFEDITVATTKNISNTDNNKMFEVKSANVVFNVANGVGDLFFGVNPRGNNPSYTIGSNYTVSPSDYSLIIKRAHTVRVSGTEIIFY